MKKSQNNAIKVFCRLRPLNQLEMSTGGETCVTFNENSVKLKVNPLSLT